VSPPHQRRIKRLEDEDDLIEILRKRFEADPGKSTIELKDKCSDCGSEVIIQITRTSGGFGLEGGVLIKRKSGRYFVKCPDCCNVSAKIDDVRLKRGLRLMEAKG